MAWAGLAWLPRPDAPPGVVGTVEAGWVAGLNLDPGVTELALASAPASAPAAAPASSPASPSDEPPEPSGSEPVGDPADGSGEGGPVEPETGTHREEGIREVVVVLNSGREIVGALVSDSDGSVVVRINGIDTTLPRARVAGIRELPSVYERYVELRKTVDDGNIRARLALVEWLRAREAYRLALQELEGILKIEPANPDARTLHTWLENHLRLASRARPARRGARPVAPAPAVPLLTDDEVNLIRVYEINLERPGRVLVPDDVMRELMARHPENFPVSFEEREALLKVSAGEKLRMLFQAKARDLYGRVRVLDDPPAMANFKARVGSGWVINACASNRCHGGAEAGRLQLFNQRPNSDRTAYTNMLILDRFVLEDGTPLINHDNPDRSPLLHMGLPRHSSLFPHPEVDKERVGQDWRFTFRNPSDRAFRQTVDWISSLYVPRPDYGIEYPRGAGGAGGADAADAADGSDGSDEPDSSGPASGPNEPESNEEPTRPGSSEDEKPFAEPGPFDP